jgi:hypothetical protein
MLACQSQRTASADLADALCPRASCTLSPIACTDTRPESQLNAIAGAHMADLPSEPLLSLLEPARYFARPVPLIESHIRSFLRRLSLRTKP